MKLSYEELEGLVSTLGKEKKLLEDLIENAGTSFYVKDINGNYTLVNKFDSFIFNQQKLCKAIKYRSRK